ncbi:MAG TPA: hypothetical protein VH186_31250 [Chloroflexia bacterium]|nr:hypothetical protein [Chloroflexia bacterium]
MLSKLSEHLKAYLQAHSNCIVSVRSAGNSAAMPVLYRAKGLQVECLVPRWADVAYYLEQNPEVILVVPDSASGISRWLQYQGLARVSECEDWANWQTYSFLPSASPELYTVFQVSPVRLDLIDESKGWGVRETLEIC